LLTYDGLEIDMLNVGCADAILITRWTNGVASRVLVDGGNKKDYDDTVKPFLKGLSINHLDAIVCSHPHDDHAAGLLELIKARDFSIGAAFVHVPQWHVNVDEVNFALRKASGTDEARVIEKSLATVADLVNELRNRGIEPSEPFAGSRIGDLFVLGPSKAFYEDLIQEFAQSDKIMGVEKSRHDYASKVMSEEIVAAAFGTEPEYGLLVNPEDTPENQSSTILWAKYGDDTYILTADAGVQALQSASKDYTISNCYWMQIPHHGSRRNVTKQLIEHFSPKVAFVSAPAGDDKHPRKSVITAFKNAGAQVYSTHYPTPGPLRHHVGNVPERPGYFQATSLWNKS
jgi:beta-lactamase superfamily II metal-dependent hydrolase